MRRQIKKKNDRNTNLERVRQVLRLLLIIHFIDQADILIRDWQKT
jgi:hypothetical protein